MIAKPVGQPGLGCGLRHRPLHPGDQDDRAPRFSRRFGAEFEHRRQHAIVVDAKLGGMDAERQPAGAGSQIVAAEGALPALVEPQLGGQRQRMSRDHAARSKELESSRRRR